MYYVPTILYFVFLSTWLEWQAFEATLWLRFKASSSLFKLLWQAMFMQMPRNFKAHVTLLL